MFPLSLNTQYLHNGNLVHAYPKTSFQNPTPVRRTKWSSLYTLSLIPPLPHTPTLFFTRSPLYTPSQFPNHDTHFPPPSVPAKFIEANASLFQLSSPLPPGPLSSSSSLVIGSALTTLKPPLCPCLPSTPPSLISCPEENWKSQSESCSRPSTAGR